MARPQAITLDRGGLVSEYLPIAAGATPLVEIVNAGGGIVVAGRTPDTVDAVSTTLSAAAAMGARTLTVASATGIVVGRRYRILPGAPYGETVKVRAISGTTLTLSAPTCNPYASGSAFVGTYVAVAVTAAEASSLFFDGCATWTWAAMGTTPPVQTPVECVRFPIVRTATLASVRAIYPLVHQLLPAEADAEEMLDSALDAVLLAVKFRPNTVRGSSAFERATCLRFLLDAFDAVGNSAEFLDRWQGKLFEAQETLDRFGVDENQDGAITSEEGVRTSVRLGRSS